MKRLKLLLFLIFTCVLAQAQTLIINEFSNGPSGSKEYVEFLVIDNTVVYDCNSTTPPCIDIRGWIFDDNSGYHGTSGQASGAVRFNNNPLWSCVPVGTLILVYNGGDVNPDIPADDFSNADGNFKIVIDLENLTYFEFTETTPGAAVCSYPATGWGADPSPTWSNVGMANGGDCARIVDLGGCEVFSVCYGSCSTNPMIYFAGGGADMVWNFQGTDPFDQSNWTADCAGDIAACGSNDQTPGFPNSAANQTYIAQFNNGGNPITPLVVGSSVNMPIACGCTNSATATASGSIPGYTFEWYDDVYTSIGQSTATATNLCAGTYNVIITSSINCIDTSQVTITGSGAVNAGDDATVSLCSDMPALNLIDELLGTPNLGGTWTGPSALTNGDQGTFDPSSNTAGIYKYVVLGSGGCPNDTALVTITMGTAPNAGIGTTLNLCSSGTSINLFDELTGSPQNTGVWQGPSVLTNGNLGTFNPSSNTNGDYMYIITGNGACVNDTAFVTVNVSAAPDAGLDNTVSICDAASSIDLFTELLGTPDAGGSWSPALTSGTGVFDPLVDAAGIYTYSIIGSAPCITATAEIDVTVNSSPTVVENITHVSCNGAGDASVDLVITPAVGNTVVWTLPSTNTVTQEDIGPVSDGSYSYEVTGTGGCVTSNTVVLNQPLPLVLTLNVTQQTCPGSCDGEIQAVCTNGIGAVTYSINGGSFGAGSFTGLCDGNINITAEDGNGCQVTTNTVMSSINPSVEPNIDPVANVCLNGGIVNLTADVVGGTWTGFGITNGQTGSFDPLQGGVGVYNVIYTVSGFCGGDDTVAIAVVENPVGQIELSDVLGCAPLEVNISNLLADPSNATCEWNLGNGTSMSSCAAFNYTYTVPGCYDIDLQITSVDGCVSSFNAPQQVCVEGSPDATFTYNSLFFEDGSSVFAGDAVEPLQDSFEWFFTGNSVSNSPSYTFDLDGLGAGNYEICLEVENIAGCQDSMCKILEFEENFSVFIPNTFSPNGDGINDLFFPVFFSALPEEYELLIFDRWGQLVVETSDFNYTWDGTFKSSLAQQDTYVWKINYKLFNDTGINTKTGHVNLIR